MVEEPIPVLALAVTDTHETVEAPLRLSHVADRYRLYPGEMVTFHTRVDVLDEPTDFTLRVSVEAGMRVVDFEAVGHEELLPQVYEEVDATFLIWSQQGVQAGRRYEYRVRARVSPTQWDVQLGSLARTVTKQPDDTTLMMEEGLRLLVRAKGSYLSFLPSIYDQDDLMGRFLMLFESFLAPIDQQIDQIHHYFDPDLAPATLLPWLASWLDLTLDERWPLERQRELMGAAAQLYRKRGTRQGLEEAIRIYTGETPQIIEHRANNFLLGPGARLGPGVALGKSNVPHTFTVILRLPPIEAESDSVRARLEAERRRAIERIIQLEKPAHTAYHLFIESTAPSLELEEAGMQLRP